MKYNYREGVERRKSRKRLLVPVLFLMVGLYALVTYLAPEIMYVVEPPDATAKKLVSERPKQNQNHLYIPKLNANMPITSETSGDSTDTAAQERSITSGTPDEGGNYVLAANRFSVGMTPMATKAKSPFYHLAKLSKGDDIYVDYKSVRYAYKVEEINLTQQNVSEYEDRTDDPHLTLYTSASSRPHVVIAKQVGRVVWAGNQPKLQPLPDS